MEHALTRLNSKGGEKHLTRGPRAARKDDVSTGQFIRKDLRESVHAQRPDSPGATCAGVGDEWVFLLPPAAPLQPGGALHWLLSESIGEGVDEVKCISADGNVHD